MSAVITTPAMCKPAAYEYRHDPYDAERSCLVSYEPEIAPTTEQALPAGTIHKMLHGYVTYFPYPEQAIEVSEPTADDQQYMTTKAFIGQLPFHVTQMQLAWICSILGCRVANPQRIMKTQGGVRQPTGGVHVFCDEATYKSMQQNMHKRVLIDDTGIWFAATAAEKQAMDSYVAYLHENRQLRRSGRPYDSVVVQLATSTFVPRRQVRFD